MMEQRHYMHQISGTERTKEDSHSTRHELGRLGGLLGACGLVGSEPVATRMGGRYAAGTSTVALSRTVFLDSEQGSAHTRHKAAVRRHVPCSARDGTLMRAYRQVHVGGSSWKSGRSN